MPIFVFCVLLSIAAPFIVYSDWIVDRLNSTTAAIAGVSIGLLHILTIFQAISIWGS